MRSKTTNDYHKYIQNIGYSGLSIYDSIDINNQKLWIPSQVLQELLQNTIVGLSLRGLPLRTRSKVLKQNICRALNYPVPLTFKKTRPRFPGQNFDTYIQKSNNLQIWNEEIEPTRRYVIIKVDTNYQVRQIRIVTGQELALLDKTGTLTKKYQARVNSHSISELVTLVDTNNLLLLPINKNVGINKNTDPTELPRLNSLLPISVIYQKLIRLVGKSFLNAGYNQERNRGALLHELINNELGYKSYHDNGQFPDILNQLLEVKLQTSPTIDLGLISPDSLNLLDMPPIDNVAIKYCDVRYAIFCAQIDGKKVKLKNLILTTGEKFFERFPKFQGKVVNAKIQIPLPRDFFI